MKHRLSKQGRRIGNNLDNTQKVMADINTILDKLKAMQLSGSSYKMQRGLAGELQDMMRISDYTGKILRCSNLCKLPDLL